MLKVKKLLKFIWSLLIFFPYTLPMGIGTVAGDVHRDSMRFRKRMREKYPGISEKELQRLSDVTGGGWLILTERQVDKRIADAGGVHEHTGD
jgi:hypothetical protein